MLKIIQLCFFYNFRLINFDKNKKTMNFITESILKNRKVLINKNISSKKNKCQCGKTKDSNGNCDGSHANK